MKLTKEMLKERIESYQYQIDALPPKPWPSAYAKSYAIREKEMLRKIHCYSKELAKKS